MREILFKKQFDIVTIAAASHAVAAIFSGHWITAVALVLAGLFAEIIWGQKQ